MPPGADRLLSIIVSPELFFMKNIRIYLLCVSIVLAACSRKSDLNIDGQPTDVRIANALAAYQQKLTDAPYGWILTEYTNGIAVNGGVTRPGPKSIFTFYMTFGKDEQVSMISDFNNTTTNTFGKSGYRVKAVQRPTLIFDTYSYVHYPCDPDASISGSPYGDGFGWGTDFEFSFADSVGASQLGDTIRLTGNLNNCTATLVKATQAQQQSFTTSGFSSLNALKKILTYFKRVTAGGVTFEITPGIGNRTFNIAYQGQTAPVNVPVQFLGQDLVFGTPLNIGGQTVKSLNALIWNDAAGNISATLNGSAAATISPAIAPLVFDRTIAASFYQEGFNNPWISPKGFLVNGVDDAYDIRHLPYPGETFYAFVFFPGRVSGGGGRYYDILSPFFIGGNNNYPYIFAGGVSFTRVIQGRLVPRMLFGGDPIQNPPGLLATNQIFATGQTDPSYSGLTYGFYIIKKEINGVYDMVTAGDATGWMTWQHQ